MRKSLKEDAKTRFVLWMQEVLGEPLEKYENDMESLFSDVEMRFAAVSRSSPSWEKNTIGVVIEGRTFIFRMCDFEGEGEEKEVVSTRKMPPNPFLG